jgi:hypothetical protein
MGRVTTTEHREALASPVSASRFGELTFGRASKRRLPPLEINGALGFDAFVDSPFGYLVFVGI